MGLAQLSTSIIAGSKNSQKLIQVRGQSIILQEHIKQYDTRDILDIVLSGVWYETVVWHIVIDDCSFGFD